MSADTLTIRLSPEVKAAVVGLVERGVYRSISEFVVEAVLLSLDVQGIPVVEARIPPDPIAAYFASPRGEEGLRRAVRRELEAMLRADEVREGAGPGQSEGG